MGRRWPFDSGFEIGVDELLELRVVRQRPLSSEVFQHGALNAALFLPLRRLFPRHPSAEMDVIICQRDPLESSGGKLPLEGHGLRIQERQLLRPHQSGRKAGKNHRQQRSKEPRVE